VHVWLKVRDSKICQSNLTVPRHAVETTFLFETKSGSSKAVNGTSLAIPPTERPLRFSFVVVQILSLVLRAPRAMARSKVVVCPLRTKMDLWKLFLGRSRVSVLVARRCR
jgi:hypothetical protein